MPIVNRVADLQPDIQAWRRDIHENPELLYDVHRTAAFVADRLREFGCDEVATGLGRTGVVGVIKGKRPAGKGDIKVIGLRADMDALPIEEETNLPYASKTPGKMHACGHDGHTAMLLGAARYLAETRNFAGDAVVIFQPAEEGGAGAAAMIKDGLMDRFGIEQVYGMHNGPGIPVGSFAIRPGPDHGGDRFHRHQDRGARRPRRASAQLHRFRSGRLATDHGAAVDRIAQRRSAGIGGDFDLRVPRRQRAQCDPADRRTARHRPHSDAGSARNWSRSGCAKSSPAWRRSPAPRSTCIYERGYPVTVNHASQTDFATRIAKEIAGDANVHETPPMMGAEDFAYMLEARPGAFIFCGNGDSAGLHHPAYNFNDEAIVYGTSYWIKLVENTLAA